MTTSRLSSDTQSSYFRPQAVSPSRISANRNTAPAQGQNSASFQSELAAHSSSLSTQGSGTNFELPSGKQDDASASFDRQAAEASSQKASSSSPANLLLSATGSAQLQVCSSPVDVSGGKSLGSADQKKPASSREKDAAVSTDRAGSFKQPTTRDHAPRQQQPRELNEISPPNQQSLSQAATEDSCTLSGAAPSPENPADPEIAETTQVEQVGKSKSTAVTGELAVGLQIRPVQPNQLGPQTPDPVEAEAANTPASSTTIGREHSHELGAAIALSGQPERHASETVQASAQVVDSGTHTQSDSGNRSSAPAAQPAKATEFQAELENATTEPVRGAHVQVAGENNERIDVRLFERNGALSVTVRSSDPGLTQALQDRVPELTSRLSSDHFRTEVWTPNFTHPSQPSNFREGNSQRNGSGAQGEQGSDQRRGNKGHQQQPGWIDELEAHPVPIFRKG